MLNIQDEQVQDKPQEIKQLQSKRQQKKLLKRQKIVESRKIKRQEQKLARKEQQLVEKTIEEIKEHEDQQTIADQIQTQDPKKKRRDYYIEKMKEGQKVIIDLQFLEQMTEQEKTSLYKQIELCHSMNYKSQNPLNLIVSSIDQSFQQRLQNINANNWGIELTNQHYLDKFKKEDLVYLTGDAQDDMEEVDETKAYIIGGLVDHNRLKDITYKKANEQEIKTKRFPIGKYMTLKTSTILTVNQVFEILLRLKNNENWQEALTHSIPKRKVQEIALLL